LTGYHRRSDPDRPVEHNPATAGHRIAPESPTYVNRFHFVGTSGAASYDVKQTQHFTFNANGELTSDVNIFEMTCE